MSGIEREQKRIDELNDAITRLCKTVIATPDFAAQLMLLPEGEWQGMNWEAHYRNLVSKGDVAEWIVKQLED